MSGNQYTLVTEESNLVSWLYSETCLFNFRWSFSTCFTQTLDELDLSEAGIDDQRAKRLANALCQNKVTSMTYSASYWIIHLSLFTDTQNFSSWGERNWCRRCRIFSECTGTKPGNINQTICFIWNYLSILFHRYSQHFNSVATISMIKGRNILPMDYDKIK